MSDVQPLIEPCRAYRRETPTSDERIQNADVSKDADAGWIWGCGVRAGMALAGFNEPAEEASLTTDAMNNGQPEKRLGWDRPRATARSRQGRADALQQDIVQVEGSHLDDHPSRLQRECDMVLCS